MLHVSTVVLSIVPKLTVRVVLQVKPATAPTPPRPTPPSPVVLQQHPGAQGPLFNGPYLSYVSQIHSVQVRAPFRTAG